MKKKPTLKSIAKTAGLSVTTVSKALRDAPDIATATKERVKLIAEQTGYQPDKAALRLKTGKSNFICFVMDSEEGVNYMASELIAGITEALRATPYSLILMPYAKEEGPMGILRQIVENQTADGVILDRIEYSDRRLTYLYQAGVPVATYGRSGLDIQHAYYDFDCEEFGRDAVRLLAKMNCKRLCMILPDMHTTYARLTEVGYYEGIEETGLDDHPISSISIEDTIPAIAAGACSVLQEKNRPDGFVCGSVKSAMGVLAGVKQVGLTIGDDVELIVRQSTTNLLRYVDKPIYYIGDDCKAAGYAVANSLVGVINGEPIADHQSIEYTNIVGRSVLD